MFAHWAHHLDTGGYAVSPEKSKGYPNDKSHRRHKPVKSKVLWSLHRILIIIFKSFNINNEKKSIVGSHVPVQNTESSLHKSIWKLVTKCFNEVGNH